ncbi:RPM1 interacting protein 13-like [Silene latifolia]|uniref:RPM1 interacting protein 13-like n=1 Tax=Silene latifolia TaxID=37657 RepID=UPI003D78B29C
MGIPKSNNSIEICSSDDEQSPIRAIFCLKNRTQNMKKIEEVEDCFILDFDPSEPSPVTNLKFSKPVFDDDNDLSLISEKGQVACRDYPHPRHLCVKFPFDKTPHESHCEMCFCYICETEAPCRGWTTGLKHCNATSNGDKIWKTLKDSCQKC